MTYFANLWMDNRDFDETRSYKSTKSNFDDSWRYRFITEFYGSIDRHFNFRDEIYSFVVRNSLSFKGYISRYLEWLIKNWIQLDYLRYSMVMHVCRRRIKLHISCEVDGCSCCDFERYLHGKYPFVSPKQFRHIQETIRNKDGAKVGKKLHKNFKSR